MPQVSHRPATLTILLPTYNRAAFLPAAFESIAAQSFTDWDLVVVDDGSTDDTEEVVRRLAATVQQPVRFIRQANAGAYGARNTALDAATGTYVALFDRDDDWLPHQLANCVQVLEASPDVDWVYGACRIVDHQSGRLIDPDTFLLNGKPRPFRRLVAERRGGMHVLTDPQTTACALTDGL